MKISKTISCFFSFLIFALLLSTVSCTKKQEPGQQIVMSAGEFNLTAVEFSEQIVDKLSPLNATLAKNKTHVQIIKEKLLDDFLVKSVNLTWAKNNSIIVPRAELEEKISLIQKSYPDDLAFKKALLVEKLNFTQWKAQVRYRILVGKIVHQLKKTIPEASEKELKAFYKENPSLFTRKAQIKLKHIHSQNMADAERIFNEVKRHGNGSFGKIAAEFSTGPEASDHGNMGWINEEQGGELMKPLFKYPVGRRSSVLKSEHGFHIFLVKGKRSKKKFSYKDSKKKISKILVERQFQDIYYKWLKDRISELKIFKNQPLIDSLNIYTEA